MSRTVRKCFYAGILTVFIGYLGLITLKTLIYYIYFKYPKFYYRQVSDEKLGIPVLMYHTITPESFHKDLQYLKKNGYCTLPIDSFFYYIQTNKKPKKHCVLIAFDDGRKTLYKVAYPLLCAYKMNATAFILPFRVDHPVAPYSASEDEDFEKQFDGQTFVNWNEVQEMYASGRINFQSHTLNQYSIPISEEVIDFYHPDYRKGFAFDRLPVYAVNEFNFNVDTSWGRPVYQYASRCRGLPVYYEDLDLTNYCIQYVKQNGGISFFKNKDWKSELKNLLHQYRLNYTMKDSLETSAQMQEKIRIHHIKSKEKIEYMLPGHHVNFLATPWGENSYINMEIARDCGYQGIFITDHVGKRSCFYGDNPYKLSRIDATENLVASLPGHGRTSFVKRFVCKWFEYLLHPMRI